MQTALSVKMLSKSYKGVDAVCSLSFEVNKGEVFGLLGHNGAGKTTTMECILGTKRMDDGCVKLLGMNPKKDRKRLFEKVGVQFQQSSYPDKIKVCEICDLTASLYKDATDWRSLLDAFGLKSKSKVSVSALSGGERQKLSVLLALIPNPEFVFLDELTTGLDAKARRDVWNYLIDLKGRGMTTLLTSHYMDEVELLCDRVCILKDGKVVILDSVKNIIDKSPYDNLEEAYLWYVGEENSYEGLSKND